MNSDREGQTSIYFEVVLDQSNISHLQDDVEKKHKAQLQKVTQQLTLALQTILEKESQVVHKEKLLNLQKNTSQALSQQLKALKDRTKIQQERIRNLQSKQKNQRSRKQQSSKIEQGQTETELFSQVQADLKAQLHKVKQQLWDEKKRCLELQRKLKEPNPQLNLKKQAQERQQKASNHSTQQKRQLFRNSRQFEALRLELDQEKSKSQKYEKEINELKRNYQQLRIKYNKEMSSLKKELSQTTTQMEKISKRLTQKQLNKQQKCGKEQISVQFSQLPSQIKPKSRLVQRNFQDDQEYFESDTSIKTNNALKSILQKTLSHLLGLPRHQKHSFLSAIGSWADQVQERYYDEELDECDL